MTDDELRENVESLRTSVHELFEAVHRHDAQLEELVTAARQNGVGIRALAQAAETRDRRF